VLQEELAERGDRVRAGAHDESFPNVAAMLERRDEARAYKRRFAGARGAQDSEERLLRETRGHLLDGALSAEEAGRIAFLERFQAGVGVFGFTVGEHQGDVGPRDGLELAKQLTRRREAIGLALEQAPIDHGAQLSEVGPGVAHARHRLIEIGHAIEHRG
jgi:hypothetical protein